MKRALSTVRMISLMAAVSFSAAIISCSRNSANQGSKQGGTQKITIKGSDTMVNLVSAWAEEFMKANPNIEINVTGGGSGTGIAALINNTTDICSASREMKDQEKTDAEKNKIQPKETVAARDGIAVVVNPGNPLTEINMDQLRKIYNGAYTNWSRLGGPDQPITVLSRESSSGTYVYFQEEVLKKDDYTPSARLMTATSAIIQSVSADLWSIGYVGLGYAKDAGTSVTVLKIKADEQSQAIAPSDETVLNGSYILSRPLYFYTNGEPQGAIKTFIDFCLGDEGQKIVTETGYVPVK